MKTKSDDRIKKLIRLARELEPYEFIETAIEKGYYDEEILETIELYFTKEELALTIMEIINT